MQQYLDEVNHLKDLGIDTNPDILNYHIPQQEKRVDFSFEPQYVGNDITFNESKLKYNQHEPSRKKIDDEMLERLNKLREPILSNSLTSTK